MSGDYVTLKIPKELARLIDKYVEESGAGYRSRAEFTKEAIREKIFNNQNNHTR
jgi:metal-responsive CopG/Arc/MetJ family transcriptional regulator